MPEAVNSKSLLPWPNPRWKENPYQKILYEGLSKNGVKVRSTPPAFSLLPYVPRCDWLHLNWPESLFTAPEPDKRASQLSRFVRIVERLKRRGSKVFWTMHNEFPHEGEDYGFYEEFNAKLSGLADLIHVHFAEGRTILQQRYGVAAESVHVMQHPLYGNHYGDVISNLEARQGMGIDPDAQVVLVFGYIREYKGIETAVESLLETDNPSLRLLVAGKVEDEKVGDVVRTAAAKDARILTRLGKVEPPEVMPLFAAADAFLFPSREFFTSGSLMLALTYGVPVIAAPLNHAATLSGRSFFNPWEPATPERLTGLLRDLPDWLNSVSTEDFDRIWKEWSAESLTVGLAERLRR